MSFLAKLKNIVRSGMITGPADNSAQLPVQQMTFKGKACKTLMVFPYGVYANVSSNALAIFFSVEGDDGNRAAIGYTPKDRPDDLEQNEIAIYHPFTKSFIKFRNNGDIDINSVAGGNGSININTVNVNLTASGDVTATIGGEMTATVTGDAEINTAASARIIATTDVTIDTAETIITGNLTVDGGIDVSGSTTLGSTVTSNGVDISDTHIHPHGIPNTGPPI